MLLPLFLVVGSGCQSTEDASDGGVESSPDASGRSCTCLALGADYANGVGIATVVEIPSGKTTKSIVPVSGDPVVRSLGGELLVINRYGGDSIVAIDRANWTVKAELSTGPGSNPQDTAVVGSHVYVATFGLPAVQVFDLAAGNLATALATIDLRPYVVGEDDGENPEASSIAVMNGKVLVTLAHLDSGFSPSGKGTVVVIDTASRTVETSFELANANPLGFVKEVNGELVTTTAPSLSAGDGCLERITADGKPGPGGCLIENAVLGGYANGIAAGSSGQSFLAVTPGFGKGRLVVLEQNGTTTTLSPPERVVTAVAYCDAAGAVVYTDAAVGGLRLYDLASHAELWAEPIDIGLPPVYQESLACW
ncbi:MAG: hypothetical protein V2A73_12250 [Pseudomonadota bacterium]